MQVERQSPSHIEKQGIPQHHHNPPAEKAVAGFTTVLKRTLAYHDLDSMIVYQKRNRATVNRTLPIVPTKTKLLQKKVSKPATQKQPPPQPKTKPKREEVIEVPIKAPKTKRIEKKKPKMKYTFPKPKQAGNTKDEKRQQMAKSEEQQEQPVSAGREREKGEEKKQDRGSEQKIKVECRMEVEQNVVIEAVEKILPPATIKRTVAITPLIVPIQPPKAKEVKPKVVSKPNNLSNKSLSQSNKESGSGTGKNQTSSNLQSEQNESEQSQKEESSDKSAFKRVLRARSGRNLREHDNSYDESNGSEGWGVKKRSKKSRAAASNKNTINKIFEREKAANIHPEFVLKVSFNHLNYLRFAEIFGSFDLIMITKPLRHFIHFNNFTALSRVGFLFLWIKPHELQVGYHMLEKWSYDIVDQIIWVKTNEDHSLHRTASNLFDNSIEICLVGYKSLNKEYVQYKSKVSNNIIFANPSPLGHKPLQIYKICELMLPGGRRLNIGDKSYNGWMTLIDQSLQYDLDDNPNPTHSRAKYLIPQQFNVKCYTCHTYIRQICFQCFDCNEYLCRGCMFDFKNKDVKEHVLCHDWDIFLECEKNNPIKNKNCFHCKNELTKEMVSYVCENCNNVYVCGECEKREGEREGEMKAGHCHNAEHYLALVV